MGDDQPQQLQALAVKLANESPSVEVPRVKGEDNRCSECREADTDCTGKCEAYT